MGGGVSGILPNSIERRNSILLAANGDDLDGYLNSLSKNDNNRASIVDEMIVDLANIVSTYGNSNSEKAAKFLLSGFCIIKNSSKPIGLLECISPSATDVAINSISNNIKPKYFKHDIDNLIIGYELRCQNSKGKEKSECLKAINELKKILNIIP